MPLDLKAKHVTAPANAPDWVRTNGFVDRAGASAGLRGGGFQAISVRSNPAETGWTPCDTVLHESNQGSSSSVPGREASRLLRGRQAAECHAWFQPERERTS
jgi:hypothetical protein